MNRPQPQPDHAQPPQAPPRPNGNQDKKPEDHRQKPDDKKDDKKDRHDQ